MDPIQTPVPTAPIAAPTVDQTIQQTPVQAVPQDSFFDKLLKWLVDGIGGMINKTATPTVSGTPNIQIPIPEPIQAPANILDNISSGLENIANKAIDITQNWVNSVVQKTQQLVTEPVGPQTSDENVQDFLTQNYKTTPEVTPVAPETTPITPEATPVTPTNPTPIQ